MKRQEIEELILLFCMLYNAGYQAGHHYTVEGGFFPITQYDRDTYHEEEVREVVDDYFA